MKANSAILIHDTPLEILGNVKSLRVKHIVNEEKCYDEILIDLIIEKTNGKLFQRDIFVMETGRFDTGSTVKQRDIKHELERRNRILDGKRSAWDIEK